MAYKKKSVAKKKPSSKKKTSGRSKLDANKNGKIDREDFKILRSRKKKTTKKRGK